MTSARGSALTTSVDTILAGAKAADFQASHATTTPHGPYRELRKHPQLFDHGQSRWQKDRLAPDGVTQ